MPRLILNPGTPGAREFQLKPGMNRVGRKIEGNDISIPDLSISGYHCTVLVSENEVTLEDLASTNGTYVDGAPVRRASLKDGQAVHLGNAQFLFLARSSPESKSLNPVGAGTDRVRTGAIPYHSAASSTAGDTAGTAIPMPPPPTHPGSNLSAVVNRSTVNLPAIEAGDRRCKSHPRSQARYQCPQCRDYFCGLCVVTRPGAGATKFCRHCSVPCIPLRVDLQKQEVKGFFGSLPGALAYPFVGSGPIILLGAAVLFSILDALTLPLVGLFIAVIATGYLFSYLETIIHSTVAGDSEMPDFPDWGELFEAFLQFAGTAAISFLPMFLLMAARTQVSSPTLDWMIPVSIVFGCAYFPMAFLAVSMKSTLMAANPLFVVASILKVPLQYAVAAVLVIGVFWLREAGATLVAWVAAQKLLGGSAGELVLMMTARLLWAFIGMYLLTVSMRVLGLLYLTNKEKLGWFGR